MEEVSFKTFEQAQIFLCYAKEDQKQVELLYNRLKKEGLRVWLDEKELLPGQNWEVEIKRAIRESSFFIACLSKNAVTKKGFLNREIREAQRIWEEQPEGKVYLIPALLEPCDVPDGLRHLQWVNVSTEEGIEQLLISLGSRPRETEFSELRERATAVYNSYLVRVQVIDKTTGKPIHKARVELNIIETNKPRVFKKEEEQFLLLRSAEYFKPVVSTTNAEGLAFFGILPHLIVSSDTRYIISASAPGFGYKHKVLNYPLMRLIARILIRALPAIPLTANEVNDLEADETVKLELGAED